jgi:hypothetical protein
LFTEPDFSVASAAYRINFESPRSAGGPPGTFHLQFESGLHGLKEMRSRKLQSTSRVYVIEITVYTGGGWKYEQRCAPLFKGSSVQ